MVIKSRGLNVESVYLTRVHLNMVAGLMYVTNLKWYSNYGIAFKKRR